MGRPILYRTSKEFLMRFGLSDLDELPSLKEFEQLARAALGSDEGIATVDPEEAGLDATQAAVAPDTAESTAPSDMALPSSSELSGELQHNATEPENSPGTDEDADSPKSRAESAS